MYTELVFILHIVLSAGFLLFSARLGKECLIAFLSLSAVLANLFVTKEMTLCSLTVTCSDVYAVQAILALNYLQEYYGKKAAEKASVIGFICLVFFAVMAKMHLAYPPSIYDSASDAFARILVSTPRIVLASITTFFLVQRLDIVFFRLLQNWLKGKYFPIRAGLSMMVSQTLDTTLFAFLGLYGIVHHIGHVIMVSLFVKILVIWLSAPFTTLSGRFLGEKSHV